MPAKSNNASNNRSKREDYTSVTVWIPKKTHLDIKVHCAKSGLHIQDYLEDTIQSKIDSEVTQ